MWRRTKTSLFTTSGQRGREIRKQRRRRGRDQRRGGDRLGGGGRGQAEASFRQGEGEQRHTREIIVFKFFKWDFLRFLCSDGLLYCTSLPPTSTSLPQTSSRWFDQHTRTFPHSKKCRQLISATSMIILPNKFLGMSRIEPGTAGWEAQMLPLCYAAPTGFFILLKYETFVTMLSIICRTDWLFRNANEKRRSSVRPKEKPNRSSLNTVLTIGVDFWPLSFFRCLCNALFWPLGQKFEVSH